MTDTKGRGHGPTAQTERRRKEARTRAELAELVTAPTAEWAAFGACAATGDDTWFPAAEPGSPAHAAQVERARALCADCPVRRQCLAHALETGEDAGVWGGLDEDERRALRRVGIVRGPLAA